MGLMTYRSIAYKIYISLSPSGHEYDGSADQFIDDPSHRATG